MNKERSVQDRAVQDSPLLTEPSRLGQHLSILHFQITGSPHKRIQGINLLETSNSNTTSCRHSLSQIHRSQVQSSSVQSSVSMHCMPLPAIISLLPNE